MHRGGEAGITDVASAADKVWQITDGMTLQTYYPNAMDAATTQYSYYHTAQCASRPSSYKTIASGLDMYIKDGILYHRNATVEAPSTERSIEFGKYSYTMYFGDNFIIPISQLKTIADDYLQSELSSIRIPFSHEGKIAISSMGKSESSSLYSIGTYSASFDGSTLSVDSTFTSNITTWYQSTTSTSSAGKIKIFICTLT